MTMRAVIYDRLGGPEVLEVREVPQPHAGAGEVRVRVHAAGLNPLDAKLFEGRPTSGGYQPQFPAGNGEDFAGVVDQTGDGVAELAVGDAVYGTASHRAQSDYVVVPAERLSRIPDGLTMSQAGALDTVARTAWASHAILNLGPDDVVLVSAAAGGVGLLAAQLARRTGATVIGTASESNHEFLRGLGITPVTYGPGLADRVREAAPSPLTGALDNHGRETVLAALELGLPGDRINTIADYAAEHEFGALRAGASRATRADREAVAALIASGELVLPVEAEFPLERVRDAYELLLGGHLRGKIVLRLTD